MEKEQITRQDIYTKEVEIRRDTKITIGLAIAIIASVLGSIWFTAGKFRDLDHHIQQEGIHKKGFEIVDQTFERKEYARLKNESLLREIKALSDDMKEIKEDIKDIKSTVE